jgi:polar amino acid transport system substrate-binding protein
MKVRTAVVAAGASLLVALVLASAQAATIQPPSAIQKAGKIIYCSDITYPPEESYKGTTPVGSDIDIGTAIAKLMGVKAEFKNTTFDGIIAALLATKCNAVISGMNDTAQRRKAVGFVDYLAVGQSLLVMSGTITRSRLTAAQDGFE